MKTDITLSGLKHPEGLRWHNNNLYFCDIGDKKIYCYDSQESKLKTIIELSDQAGGITWSQDGGLCFNSFYNRKLCTISNNEIVELLDYEDIEPGYAHDMTTSPDGIIYVSTSGFLPAKNVNVKTSNILGIKDNLVFTAAKNVEYPNGIVVSEDGQLAYVSETFSGRIKKFDIDNGFLINPRALFQFDDLGFQVEFNELGIPKNINRYYPDGMCLNVDKKSIWVASPGYNTVINISENGLILSEVDCKYFPFDCAISDNGTLYIGTLDPNTGKGYIESICT